MIVPPAPRHTRLSCWPVPCFQSWPYSGSRPLSASSPPRAATVPHPPVSASPLLLRSWKRSLVYWPPVSPTPPHNLLSAPWSCLLPRPIVPGREPGQSPPPPTLESTGTAPDPAPSWSCRTEPQRRPSSPSCPPTRPSGSADRPPPPA